MTRDTIIATPTTHEAKLYHVAQFGSAACDEVTEASDFLDTPGAPPLLSRTETTTTP